MLTKPQLIAKARMYLQDALDTECSTHTRYSAAMSALQCLCLAGVAGESDATRVESWEATRYNAKKWPSALHVSLVIERVGALLHRDGDN